MHPFVLDRPADLADAIALQAARTDASVDYIAGGTDMVQLLQEHVRRPDRLVSLRGLLDDRIELAADGLHVGSAATMAKAAAHPDVVAHFPLIAEALLNSASPQVRNQATVGGNVLQRTRCPYFRDLGYAACNKRDPGSGCSAIGGENRWNAVLGTSEHCIAAHASDLAVALVALDAQVELHGTDGVRRVALDDLYRLPEDTPHIETVLQPGELITRVVVPRETAGWRSHYQKVRDRASFEFALVSAAVALDMEGGRIREARVALGGVGTKPWRVRQVEAALVGLTLDAAARGGSATLDGEASLGSATASSKRPDSAPLPALREAAAYAAEDARGHGSNDFKIELMQRAIVRAVEIAGARA
jgi:xanthine dehydrogenase YagS FAD-binding subunit